MKHNSLHQKQFLDRIRAILLDKWDPVHIGNNPKLRDEYDAYLGGIVRLLHDVSTTAATISSYLAHVENDKMGLPGDPARRSLAAKALMELARDVNSGNSHEWHGDKHKSL